MKQPRVTRYCAYCGKPMERKRWSNGELQCWIHYNRQKYCDRECMKAAYRTKPKTGKSWMATHRYARQLLPSGCCEICGSERNVDVHHIDGNHLNNDLSNLQRVCRSCHNHIHRPAKICSICGAKAKGYGYCNKHYIRFKKFGDPLMGKKGVME